MQTIEELLKLYEQQPTYLAILKQGFDLGKKSGTKEAPKVVINKFTINGIEFEWSSENQRTWDCWFRSAMRNESNVRMDVAKKINELLKEINKK